ncbi:MAG: hypothetical protein GC171_11015 [Terrimonas sp.]|nr:hypothetical protein [Terrimonas sp.]
MKKLLFLMIALLVGGFIGAQGKNEKRMGEQFLALHVGPSFPISDFASANYDNPDAGFARTGFNLNLDYGFPITENLGITASAFFNKYKLDNAAISHDLPGTRLNHWQWYGISAGPMITQMFPRNIALNLQVMGGVANANTPNVRYQGETVVEEDWSVAPVLVTGVDLQVGISNKVFLLANMDYLYMRPKFTMKYTSTGEQPYSESIKQKISVLNLTGGFGIRF